MTMRSAARVIVVNSQNHVFLLHARDVNDHTKTWWLTCGGGTQMGETPSQTAARELAEETGLECEPADLYGPIAQQRNTMEFSTGEHTQDEVFYGYFCDHDGDLSDATWTDVEKRAILGARWWSVEELGTTQEVIYPANLRELVIAVTDYYQKSR